MSYETIWKLMVKDWYLQRLSVLLAVAAAPVAFAVVAMGGQMGSIFGVILLVTILVFVGAQVSISTMVNERKEQSLAFVMSMPVSFKEYSVAKLGGNLLIFLVPWTACLLGSVILLAVSPGSQGLIPYITIMGVEILVNICLMNVVALTTESQHWTVGMLLTTNLGFNGLGYWVAHMKGIQPWMFGKQLVWTSTATAVLSAEIAVIVLMVTAALFVQSRKRDFL
jgi:ABC-2 type transport system permease protein